jgi:hypothetical protein
MAMNTFRISMYSVLFWHLGCAIGGVIRRRGAVSTHARGMKGEWRLANALWEVPTMPYTKYIPYIGE